MNSDREQLIIKTLYGRFDKDLIKTFDKKDIDFILSQINQEEDENIIDSLDYLFSIICSRLDNYDVFIYLFDYINLNYPNIIIFKYYSHEDPPFSYCLWYNTNYNIIKYYVDYFINNFPMKIIKKKLEWGIYNSIPYKNEYIWNYLLDLIFKYDIEIFQNDYDSFHMLDYLNNLDNNQLHDFLYVMLNTSNKKYTLNDINNILENKEHKLINRNKETIQTKINEILNMNNVKSAI